MMGCHETKGQTCTEYAHDLTGHKFRPQTWDSNLDVHVFSIHAVSDCLAAREISRVDTHIFPEA